MKKKKSLLLCLCLALAFSGTVATMASCDDDDKKPSVNKPTDYQEDGTYYVTVGEAEYTVVLADGDFTLTIGEVTLEGQYSYDGEALTLKQGKKVIIAATLVNGVLNLTYEGTDYTFLAKVDFKVSFNVDGTIDEATKQTVTNGKKAQKPADPQKAGHAFVGWYADGAYTIPYSFDKAVSGDITLYARFVEVDASKKEFKITYEVDGKEYDTAQTVDGGIYGLPTPVQEGKTFVGWWTSDFDNANKLTAQVKDGDTVDENKTLYAVWKSDAPVVSVNASGATWTANGSNNLYTIIAIGPSGTPVTATSSQSRWDYDFTAQPAGEYSITVMIMGGSSTTVYYNNKGLASVTHFAVTGNVLTFDKVANATNYLITVNCGEPTHSHVDVDLGDKNAFDFSSCEMPVEGIKFTVKAVADGYVSSVSEEYVLVRNLTKVENLTVNSDTETASWKAVENAESYDVTVTIGETTKTINVKEASYSLKNYNAGEIKVSVVAKAFGYNSAAATETTHVKTRLAAPVAPTLNWQTLEWTAVDGASAYIVQIGDKTYETTTNSFKLTSENIPSGVDSVAISVMAKNADAAQNSLWSDAATVNFGTMSDNLSYKEGSVSWDPVLNVTKYEVQLNDDEAFEVDSTATSAAITFVKGGVNTIKVRCYDANGEASEWVSVDVQVYEVYLLGNGGIDGTTLYKATGDKIKLSDTTRRGYTFSGWYNAAAGGKKYDTEFTFEGTATTLIYAGWTANKYKVSVYLSIDDEEPYKTIEVTYDQGYYIEGAEDPSGKGLSFTGWYTEANGKGYRYVNDLGNSYGFSEVFKDTENVKLYGCWGEFLRYEEITGEDGGTYYQVLAGRDIENVTEIEIPTIYNGMEVIQVGAGAFENCTSLQKIRIPDTIEYIEIGDGGYNGIGNAFYYCNSAVVEIYKTEGTHKRYYESYDGALIRHNQFTGETELVFVPHFKTEFTIPSNVTVIGKHAFRNMALTKMTIPATVKKLEEGAFRNCTLMTEIVFEEAAALKEGETAPTLMIESLAFYNNNSTTTITLPSHISDTVDFETVFNDLKYVTEIKVAAKADGKYQGAYYSVDGMLCKGTGADATLVYVPYAFPFENNAFTIPTEIKKIGANAFYGRTNLVTLTVGSQVTEIGETAFKNCTALSTINFNQNKSITTDINIGAQAFYSCKSLSHVTLPVNVAKIGKNAFGDIAGLLEVTVDATTTTRMDFATNAFVSTSGVASVQIVNIGSSTPFFAIASPFGNKIASVTVAADNAAFELDAGVLYDQNKTAILYVPSSVNGAYIIPSTVTSIGAGVFEGKFITEITIPAGVTSIGDGAFENCPELTKVTFLAAADSTKEVDLTIGADAFAGCSVLTDFTLPARTVSIGDYAFDGSGISGALVLSDKVASVGAGAFANTKITSISIPEKMTSLPMGQVDGFVCVSAEPDYGDEPNLTYNVFDLVKGCGSLQSIVVAEKNTKYATVNGMLYELSFVEEEQQVIDPVTKEPVIDAETGKAKTQTVVTKRTAKLLYVPAAVATTDGTLTIGATVTVGDDVYDLDYVSSFAFYNLTGVKKVVFENSEKSIYFDNSAFYYDSVKTANEISSLEEIVLPVGAENISQLMFFNCATVKKINVPYTVSVIDRAAFFNCRSLSTLTFDATPTGKTAVDLTLADCYDSSLSSSQQKYYAWSIFYGCQSMTEVVLPERTVQIGAYAFYSGAYSYATFGEISYNWMHGIKRVVIPASVKTIGDYAFAGIDTNGYGVQRIETIEFANGGKDSKLETIGNYTFAESDISSFVFPDNQIEFGNYAFNKCRNLTSVTLPSKALATGKYMFYLCTALSEVNWTNPDDIKLETIQSRTFCTTALTSFTVPASVKTIENYAFQSIFTLKTIEFATAEVTGEDGSKKKLSNLESLGSYTFQYCYLLEEIVLPETVNELSIGSKAFGECRSLDYVYIPSTVTSVDFAFQGVSVATVEIAAGNKNLKLEDAMLTNFEGTSIKYLTDTVKADEKGYYAIPKGVETVESLAFMGQSDIVELFIPNTVKELGAYAFANMPNLKKVVFEEGNDNLTVLPNYLFYNCPKLEEVVLHEGLKTIGGAGSQAFVFAYCPSLSKITIPSTLIEIRPYSFAYSALQEIELPESFELTSMASSAPSYYAFANAQKLEKITFNGKVTALPVSFFRYCSSLKEINFKHSAKLDYIANYAFESCTSLETIDLSTVTSIGQYAFRNCSSLRSVTLGDKLATFGKSSSYIFANCTSLKEITIPAGITVLYNYDFQGCTSLEKVVFEGAVTQLGNSVFDGCTSLKTVEGLNGVTKVGNYVFRNCTSLESVSLPSLTSMGTYFAQNAASLKNVNLNPSLSKFGNYAFDGCTALENITLPTALSAVGTYAFRNCANLQAIVLPATVSSLDNYAFQGCAELASVEFVGKLQKIGNYVFDGCAALSDVTLPDTLTSIGNYAFRGCTSLASINFPATLTKIGQYAFDNAGLESLKLSAALNSVGVGAFQNCAALSAANVSVESNGIFALGEDKILRNVTGDIIWVAQDVSFENGVFTLTADTVLAQGAFAGNTTITKVVVAEGVKAIPSYAFSGMRGLTTVEIAEGVETMGNYAFAYCPNLSTVNIPSTMTTIGTFAFRETNAEGTLSVDTSNATSLKTIGSGAFYSTGLTTFHIPDGVTTIGLNVFDSTLKLTSITGAANVTTLDGYAFQKSALTTISLPNLTTIEDNGFRGSNFIELKFGDKLLSVGEYAFKDATKLVTVEFQDGVQKFGGLQGYIFWGCTSLKNVKLPATITDLGSQMFRECTSLEEITIPEGVKYLGKDQKDYPYYTLSSYGYTFLYCESLKKVNLPSTLEVISGGAFYGCTSLQTINIPDSVYIIGDEAFKDCVNLTTVNMPSNLYMIGANAFENCAKIESIVIPENVYVKGYAFSGWTAEQTINVTGDALSIYLVMVNDSLTGCNANWVFDYQEPAQEEEEIQ